MLTLSETSQSQKNKCCVFSIYVRYLGWSGSKGQKNRMEVLRGLGGGERELLLNGYRIAPGEDGKVLETDEWWCEYNKDQNCILIMVKSINFIL